MAEFRTFETGATRDADTLKNDYEGYLSPLVLEEFGDYMTEHRKQSDGSLRDSDNWQKGIPQAAYMKSLLRHVLTLWKLHRGYDARIERIGGELRVPTVTETLMAILFNAQGYAHEALKACQAPPVQPVATPGAGAFSDVCGAMSQAAILSDQARTAVLNAATRNDQKTTLAQSGRPSRAQAWQQLQDVPVGTVLYRTQGHEGAAELDVDDIPF